jgi:hypothetical protein
MAKKSVRSVYLEFMPANALIAKIAERGAVFFCTAPPILRIVQRTGGNGTLYRQMGEMGFLRATNDAAVDRPSLNRRPAPHLSSTSHLALQYACISTHDEPLGSSAISLRYTSYIEVYITE